MVGVSHYANDSKSGDENVITFVNEKEKVTNEIEGMCRRDGLSVPVLDTNGG
jgi:hypothetical protein